LWFHCVLTRLAETCGIRSARIIISSDNITIIIITMTMINRCKSIGIFRVKNWKKTFLIRNAALSRREREIIIINRLGIIIMFYNLSHQTAQIIVFGRLHTSHVPISRTSRVFGVFPISVSYNNIICKYYNIFYEHDDRVI